MIDCEKIDLENYFDVKILRVEISKELSTVEVGNRQSIVEFFRSNGGLRLSRKLSTVE